MSMVKGAGPAGVPGLFLPASENESRMLHSVSSVLKQGWLTPTHQQYTPPGGKVNSWGVALLQHAHTHFALLCCIQTHVAWTQLGNGPSVAKRPEWLEEGLKRVKRFPGLSEQNCLFFQHGGFKCVLTLYGSTVAGRSTWGPMLRLSEHTYSKYVHCIWLLPKPDQNKIPRHTLQRKEPFR